MCFRSKALNLPRVPQSQLPLLGSHLIPQNFQILLNPRVGGILAQRSREPAISRGKIARGAVPGRVHCAQNVFRLRIRVLRRRQQVGSRPRAVLRHAVSIQIFFALRFEFSCRCRRRCGRLSPNLGCFAHSRRWSRSGVVSRGSRRIILLSRIRRLRLIRRRRIRRARRGRSCSRCRRRTLRRRTLFPNSRARLRSPRIHTNRSGAVRRRNCRRTWLSATRKSPGQRTPIASPMPTHNSQRHQQQHQRQKIFPAMARGRLIFQQITQISRAGRFPIDWRWHRPANWPRRRRAQLGIRSHPWRRRKRQRRSAHPTKAVLREVFVAAFFTLNQHGSLRRHRIHRLDDISMHSVVNGNVNRPAVANLSLSPRQPAPGADYHSLMNFRDLLQFHL
jgi:hypothetical protein